MKYTNGNVKYEWIYYDYYNHYDLYKNPQFMACAGFRVKKLKIDS